MNLDLQKGASADPSASSERAGFGGGVAALVAGATSAQLVLAASAPVLTRLYSPTEFGVYAVFAAALGIVGGVSCLRFESAIALPTSRSAARHVGMIAALISVLMAATWLGIGSVLHAYGGHLTPAPWGIAVGLASLGILAMGAYKCYWGWAIRGGAMTAVAMTKPVQGLSQATVQIFGGLVSGGAPFALCAGAITGQAGGVGLLRRWLRSQNTLSGASAPAKGKYTVRRALSQLRRYRRFPLLSAPAEVLSSASLLLPPAIAAASYGAAPGGLFVLATKLIGIPLALVSKPLGEAYNVYIARARRGSFGDLMKLTLLSAGVGAIVSVSAAGLLFVWGAEALGFLLGSDWHEVSSVLLALTPLMLARMTYSPVASAPIVLEKHWLDVGMSLAKLCAATIPFVVAAVSGVNFVVAVWVYSIASATYYLLATLIVGTLVARMRTSDRDPIRVGGL